MSRETKYMLIFGIFAASITFVNLVSAKIVTFLGLTFSVGTLFYAITFPCTDIMSECWGKDKARKAVWIGFLANILILVFIWISVTFPAADFWQEKQQAFALILGLVPRIILGSMAAYLVSQLHDVYVFHFWRKWTKNRHLWFRNNASTMTSQLIDTLIFVTIAFYGTVPGAVLLSIMIGQYVVKVAIAALDTPFIYATRRWIGVPQELIDDHL